MDTELQIFELRLPDQQLDCGALLTGNIMRGMVTGTPEAVEGFPNTADRSRGSVVYRKEIPPAPTEANVRRLPTILVTHALTGDMRAGGPGGWWSPLIGPGAAIDTRKYRVICFNNLGSCYGSSGPADAWYPAHPGDSNLPAPISTWDQARAMIAALDALGIDNLELVTGGSLGAMILACLCALDPERFARAMPIAGCEAASAWIIGWNHIGRRAILADPTWPSASTGMEIARGLAMITYRSEEALDMRQGRCHAEGEEYGSHPPFRVATYLDHQGEKLSARYDARAYVTQLDAMDSHDIRRPPPGHPEAATHTATDAEIAADPRLSWGMSRFRASMVGLCIDSDQLYFPEHTVVFIERLRALGLRAELCTLNSPYGHDAFLIEWSQIESAIGHVLALPDGRE